MIQQLKLREYCNIAKAGWLMKNIDKVLLDNNEILDAKIKSQMLLYLKEILISKNGFVHRTYKSKRNGKGRMYLDHKYGYQSMKKEFRHTLANDDYYDIDIENCHPTIIYQYCIKNNISCENLEKYVKNRQDFFYYFKTLHQIDNDVIKKTILGILYGEKLKPEFENILLLSNIKKELDNIQEEVIKRNIEIVEYVKSKKDNNIKGSVLSHLACEIENNILLKVVEFFEKKEYEIGALCFDGLMILKKKELSKYLLLELNETIKNTLQYDVNFVIKEMTKGYKISDEELQEVEIKILEENGNKEIIKEAKEQLKEEQKKERERADYIIDDDAEGGNLIITKMLKNKVIKSDGRYFLKVYEDANIYKEDTTNNFIESKDYILKIVMSNDIKKRGKNGSINIYSKDINGATNLTKVTFMKLEDDENFVKKMWNSNLGKLCYRNGYYDFKKQSFCEYDNETFTPIFINREYRTPDPEKVKEFNEKVLFPIMPDEEQRTYFLNWLARGLSGFFTEKTWAVGIGRRDSGKGVITEALIETFNNYVSTFNSEEMLCQKVGFGDTAKKLSWLIPFEFTRLNFSHELKTVDENGKPVYLDGNIIKKISSGGDDMKARKNFKDQMTFKIQGRMMLNLNELIDCKPNDSQEKLDIFIFQNVFKETVTEEDLKLNARGGNQILQANNNIKNMIKSIEFKEAFAQIIFNSYTNIKLPKPEILKDNKENIINKEDNITNIIKEHYILTDNRKDKVLRSDVYKHLKGYMKLSQIKMGLAEIGCIESIMEGYVYIRYIKQKEIEFI